MLESRTQGPLSAMGLSPHTPILENRTMNNKKELLALRRIKDAQGQEFFFLMGFCR